MRTKYLVKKYHTSGLLKGMTTTEETTVKFTEGKEYTSITGSKHLIVSCFDSSILTPEEREKYLMS